jgi:hypothetical protein
MLRFEIDNEATLLLSEYSGCRIERRYRYSTSDRRRAAITAKLQLYCSIRYVPGN